jgi:hypothetical protein
MRLGIMQPYFMPYLGYFQLMNLVDKYVIYDNIQYTKKGWINRNRILVNNKDHYITLPLRKDSDYLDIKDRYLSDSWQNDKQKIINKIIEAYRKAPYFKQCIDTIQQCINYKEDNLFKFIYSSINILREYLDINTPIVISSSIDIDHSLKSEDKVLSICKSQEASEYINAIGGQELYSKERFILNDINLSFIKMDPVIYNQNTKEFLPYLSIIDVIMFNGQEKTKQMLYQFSLI